MWFAERVLCESITIADKNCIAIFLPYFIMLSFLTCTLFIFKILTFNIINGYMYKRIVILAYKIVSVYKLINVNRFYIK